MAEKTWTIAGQQWTQPEIQLASQLAREQASIQSLAGYAPTVQAGWLTRARGMLAHEALKHEPEYVETKMPPRRQTEKEARPAATAGLQTGPRRALKHEIPKSCMTMWNHALKAGWYCYVLYCRGTWIEADGDLKEVEALQVAPNLDIDTVPIYGMAEIVVLYGVREGKKFSAKWAKKPWTKDAAFKYEAGHFWPDGNGLVASPELTKRVKGVWPTEPVITEQEYS